MQRERQWHLWVGPTLLDVSMFENLDIILHPPVKSGDFMSIHPSQRHGFLVCDGVYWTEPALQLPEIQAAIQAGAIVVGVSSIGALRAADFNSKSMFGYGKIAERYCQIDNDLEDADVAVIQSKEAPYEAMTLPIINIIFTAEAVFSTIHEKIIAETLVCYLRSVPLHLRTWRHITIWASDKSDDVRRVVKLVKDGYIDQKAEDLKSCIRQLDRFESRYKPSNIHQQWDPTTWWERRLIASDIYQKELLMEKKKTKGVDLLFSDEKSIELLWPFILHWWRNENNWYELFSNPSSAETVAKKIFSDLQSNTLTYDNNVKWPSRRYMPNYIELLFRWLLLLQLSDMQGRRAI